MGLFKKKKPTKHYTDEPSPLGTPALYSLTQIFEELKYGRTAKDQLYLQECIDDLREGLTLIENKKMVKDTESLYNRLEKSDVELRFDALRLSERTAVTEGERVSVKTVNELIKDANVIFNYLKFGAQGQKQE